LSKIQKSNQNRIYGSQVAVTGEDSGSDYVYPSHVDRAGLFGYNLVHSEGEMGKGMFAVVTW
jgi:hypothetical protein